MVCAKLFPLLNSGARVVNVCSFVGWLAYVVKDQTLKAKLASDDLTEAQLDDLMNEFIKVSDYKSYNSSLQLLFFVVS